MPVKRKAPHKTPSTVHSSSHRINGEGHGHIYKEEMMFIQGRQEHASVVVPPNKHWSLAHGVSTQLFLKLQLYK